MKREFFIAGVQFRPQDEIRKAMKEIKVGDKLALLAEPTNRFDPNAIQISKSITDEEGITDFIFIGYVPKKFSSEVAGLLEAGIDLECIVTAIDPLAKKWEMCKVVIRDIKEDEDFDAEYDFSSEGDQ